MAGSEVSMASSEYLDCELYLSDRDQAKLAVDGRDYSGRPRLDEALERRLRQAELDPIRYGTDLFAALFPGEGDELLRGYREALAIARREKKHLRFRLHIATTAPAELHDLNWEYLYDPKEEIALGRARETPFSRYLSVSLKAPAAVAERPRLLVVVCAPNNLTDYQLSVIDRHEMQQSLAKALGPLRDLLSYELLEGPATLGRIRERLVEGKFHALHLQAHGKVVSDRSTGTDTAHLVLEQDDGGAAFIAQERFSGVFEGERVLRFIALVACHSGVQPAADPFSGLGPGLVKRGIPAVIAMRRAISVEAAARFAEHFYRNLARDGCLDQAANEAREQLCLAASENLEWGTPALFMRLRDALLWAPGAASARSGKTPEPESRVRWAAILKRIHDGNFIPVLGPGLYQGLLPSGQEIASRWAAQYHYPLDGHCTLPRVAQFVETKEDPGYPHDLLPQILAEELLEQEGVPEGDPLRDIGLTKVVARLAPRYFERDEDEPHRILAELPFATYVTTNCDSFLSAALHWVGKRPRRESCIWRTALDDRLVPDEYAHLEGIPEEPLVFHLYGNDQDPSSLVLTEDDYLDFLGAIAADFDLCIPEKLRAALSESMLLFLGYQVRDLDCRLLFRGLLGRLRSLRRGRIAVLQLEGDQEDSERTAELRNFIRRCCEKQEIKVYWGSVRDFLTELRDRWRAEHGRP